MLFRRRPPIISPVPPRPAAAPRGPEQPFIRFLDEPEPRPAPAAPRPAPPPTPPTPPTVVKRNREFPIGIVAFLVVVGIGLIRHRSEAWHRGQIGVADEVAKSLSVSDKPTIVVDTFNGPIEVTRGAFGRVDCIVTRQGKGPDEQAAEHDLQNVSVAILRERDNTVNVTAQQIRPSPGVQAAVRLLVPEGAILALQTRAGAISVQGIDGPVTARTNRGAIRVEDASGPVLLTSTDGPISCEGSDTVLSVDTRHGTAEFRGSLAPGQSSIHADHGGVTLHLPESQGFRLDARVDHGKIESDFDLRDVQERPRRLSGVTGTDPKATLKVRSSHGNIRIVGEE